MGLKTALEHNPVLTVGFLLAGGWIALTVMNVFASMGPVVGGNWVGPNGAGGLFGLGVMLVLGVLLVYLYAELAEVDPAPDTFPPER
ncbi:hypothetical protein [Halalkalicoccus tibetensis]|uniref:Solute:sodium symporter small subunit n=1 Tax=Halalkalicoccus tibetensis TaxID=175632 RepID=A0ABD5V281_9EURY